jgi:hypothetical protein
MGPPAKRVSPAKVKKTDSAAAVFRKQNTKMRRGNVTPQVASNSHKSKGDDADATTLLSARLHSSSHSIEKKGAKRRSSDMHALGTAFRGINRLLE